MGLPHHPVGPPFRECSLFLKTMAMYTPINLEHCKEFKITSSRLSGKPISEDNIGSPFCLVCFFHLLLPPCLILKVGISSSSKVIEFLGSVCRTETMHQLLRFKSKFPNHFAFTLGCCLFLLFLV